MMDARYELQIARRELHTIQEIIGGTTGGCGIGGS
jgi:hypothetical protein